VRTSLPSGRWHQVPCRYPDLSTDPVLRGAIRWTLERVLEELGLVDGDDRVALGLGHEATRLLDQLRDVARVYPRPELIARMSEGDLLVAQTVRSGLEAIGWVRDERGLGGGRQMDGLAWSLPLDQLWEDHVAAKVQERVRQEGGVLRLGRNGATVTPLHWSNRSHRSLGHLVPDIVVTRRDFVWIVDAKYKSHFAEIDESGWRQLGDDILPFSPRPCARSWQNSRKGIRRPRRSPPSRSNVSERRLLGLPTAVDGHSTIPQRRRPEQFVRLPLHAPDAPGGLTRSIGRSLQ
jgi:hypothetical protein